MHPSFRRVPAVRLIAAVHCAIAAMLSGCSGAGNDETLLRLETEGTPSSSNIPGLDDFAESARVPGTETDGDQYVLEGDMLTDYDGVVRYYERRFLEPQDKAVGERITVAGSIVFDRRPRPTVRYCLTGGWGGSFPTEAQVNTDLRGAMRDWERVANLYFVHVTAVDGAACIDARVTDGTVQFIVTQNSGTGSSAGLPGAAVANQKLKIGTGGIAPGLARHELGHIIGLLHESDHSLEPLGCTTEDFSGIYANPAAVNGPGDLTAYDAASIMHYFFNGNPVCVIPGTAGSGTPFNANLTTLDAVAARILYGSPAAWLPAYSFAVLM